MSLRIALLLLLLLPSDRVFAAKPGIDVEAVVTRYSEFKLTKKQTRVLDEATKVSTACRVFYGLYGRWPNNAQEIESRTRGIDYSVFKGELLLEVVPEGLAIVVFDGKQVRQLLATAGTSVPPEIQESAQDPEFRINVGLRSSPDGA